jgi:CubicO group peptidase (beta-lactamase class C family)
MAICTAILSFVSSLHSDSMESVPTMRRVIRACCACAIIAVRLGAQTPTAVAPPSQVPPEVMKASIGEPIEFDQYVFAPGKFPGFRWKDLALVERANGHFPLTADFYDQNFQRVADAKHGGRYGAVVRGTTPDGFTVVRCVTLFCSSVDLDDYGEEVPLEMRELPDFGIPSSRWQMYRSNLRKYSFGSLLTLPLHDPDAAIFLAGLSELDSLGGRTETPRMHDRRWWLEMKRRLMDAPAPRVPSHARRARPAPILMEWKPGFSGPFSDQQLQRIRTICEEWADSAGIPLTAVVAHEGRMVFEESFGKDARGRRLEVSTPTWMASITKLLTGLLVMQFVDQGILDLDRPLDQYLPELSAYPCTLTLRQCLNHTTGLSWAGEWASDWNPSLENQIAQSLPLITPGTAYSYHRSGYALTSKVLERVSGRAVPDLFDDFLLTPLGMEKATVDNTYGGLYAPAPELARLGQMLLNRGAYGDRRFLSESAFADFLPRPVTFLGSVQQKQLGVGVGYLGGHGLGTGTFGHEAASGALFRVDPEHRLVIVVGRNREGEDRGMYRRFVGRFLRAVTAPWGKTDE